jgi:tRNA pseudouridine55 synthase
VGRKRFKGRPVNGILLLDKPAGITSNAALQQVKRLFNAAKAGHTGSLDPLATGLLPLCFGEATKMSGYLLDSDKRYVGTLKLGVRTRSADAEGEIIETRPLGELDAARIEAALQEFVGEIEQIPPMHSAVKVYGTPLYKLAHQGKEIERQPRTVTIHSLRLLRFEADEVDIELHCSKGTYVRTLAEDIGEVLGCGAHLAALRRTASGPFDLTRAVSLERLEEVSAGEGVEALDALLLPMDEALADWPEIRLSANSAHYLQQGQPVLVPRAPTAGWVRLRRDDGRFLGVGQILDDGRVAPRRLVKCG